MTEGQRLARVRKHAGLSQRALADASRVDRKTISGIERNQVGAIRGRQDRTWDALAAALGARLGWRDAGHPRVVELASYLKGEQVSFKLPERGELLADELLARRVRTRVTAAARTTPVGELPKQVVVVDGAAQVENWVLKLLGNVNRHQDNDRRPILISRQLKHGLSGLISERAAVWRRALSIALDYGWDVIHLAHRPAPEDGPASFQEDLYEFLTRRGDYRPFHFSQMFTADKPSYDVVIVPDQGALALLSSGPEPDAVRGYYLPAKPDHSETDFLNPLQQHVISLQDERNSAPLITRRPIRSIEFEDALARAESNPGNRYLIMDGLGTFTVPDDVDRFYAEGAIKDGIDSRERINAFVESRVRRRKQFKRWILEYDFLEICPFEFLVRMARGDADVLDNWLADPKRRPLPPTLRRLWLETTIGLLRNRRYHLALVENRVIRNFRRTFWAVKEGQALFLEVWQDDPSTKSKVKQVDVEIREQSVVNEFSSAFMARWSALPRTSKEKSIVIEKLKGIKDGIKE